MVCKAIALIKTPHFYHCIAFTISPSQITSPRPSYIDLNNELSASNNKAMTSQQSSTDSAGLDQNKTAVSQDGGRAVIPFTNRQRALRYRHMNSHHTQQKRFSQRQRRAQRRKLWQRVALPNGNFIWIRTPQSFQASRSAHTDSLLQKLRTNTFLKKYPQESELEGSIAEQVRRKNGMSMGYFTERGIDGRLQWKQTDTATIPIDQEEEKMLNEMEIDLEGLVSLQFRSKKRWFLKQITKRSVHFMDSVFHIMIRRDYILQDSIAQLHHSMTHTQLREHLRIEFVNEPALDAGGLLREWFSLLCNELFRADFGLFVTTHAENMSYWINPNSAKVVADHLTYFRVAGRLFGKAILESLVFEVRFALPLLKHFLGVPISFSDLEFLDQELYKNCIWLRDNTNVEALCLTFSIQEEGSDQVIDLIANGRDIDVTDSNKHEYLALVLQHKMMGSVSAQLSELLAGLHEVIPRSLLAVFDYQELDFFLCGLPVIDVDDWQRQTIVRYLANESTQPKQFAEEKNVIDWFWNVLRGFSDEERARLLQFATGSSHVPVEGFRALMSASGYIHPFTIQLVAASESSYRMFPRAHTCYNRIDLPIYASCEDLANYVSLVIQMEITGFGLE